MLLNLKVDFKPRKKSTKPRRKSAATASAEKKSSAVRKGSGKRRSLKTNVVKPPPDPKYIFETVDKTFVVGFLMNIASYENMFKDLCTGSDPPMSYLSTYRTSQDHLECFFSTIRAAGGWNFNPSPYLFQYLFRKCMLLRARDVANGNCILQVSLTSQSFTFPETVPTYMDYRFKIYTKKSGRLVKSKH